MTKIFVFILFLFISLEIHAQPAVVVGSAFAELGDTVSIPIDYIGTGSGVVALQVDVSFDNTVLTLATGGCGNLGGIGVSCSDKGTYVRLLVIDFGLNELPSGSMGFLEFTVSPGSAIPFTYPLTIIAEDYSDAASNSIPALGSQDGSIVVGQLFSIGGNISGLGVSSVTLQNNFTDDLVVSANGVFVFPAKLADLTNYNVTVLNQPTSPDQTCTVSGGTNGDGTGLIAAADALDIQLTCNNSPIVITDSYVVLEDSVLFADDVNGDVNDNNDDGVLVNDFDNDALFIVVPGTYDPIGGIGGSLIINGDGTLNYTPPANTFGVAMFSFAVSDGFSVVPSSLSINVTPVNDQPSFDDSSNIVSFPFITPPNLLVQFPNFANNINLGPLENMTQSVDHFNLSIISDTDSILVPATTDVGNDGTLTLDLTSNEGVAVLQLELVDDGGTNNGGVDTSIIHEFSVSFFDNIFQESFEGALLLKLHQENSELIATENSIHYKNHELNLLDNRGKQLSKEFINHWVSEIDTLEKDKK